MPVIIFGRRARPFTAALLISTRRQYIPYVRQSRFTGRVLIFHAICGIVLQRAASLEWLRALATLRDVASWTMLCADAMKSSSLSHLSPSPAQIHCYTNEMGSGFIEDNKKVKNKKENNLTNQ